MILAWVLATAAARPALAQPADEKARAQAEVHFVAGNAHVDGNRMYEAIREYKIAYELYPSPAILYNMAIAYELSGSLESALKTYRKVVASDYDNAEHLADARAKIAKLEATVGSPDKSPPPSRTALRWTGVGVTALGVVTLAVGGKFMADVRAAEDDVADAQTRLDVDGTNAALDAGETAETRMIVALACGTAAIATGIGLYLWARPDSESSVAVTAAPTAQGGGLVVWGRF